MSPPRDVHLRQQQVAVWFVHIKLRGLRGPQVLQTLLFAAGVIMVERYAFFVEKRKSI